MPLGKYYCDYCDKQFQDTPFARKRHLQSLHHRKSKALWFDSFNFNDPNSEGFAQGVCHRFVKTGFCQFGDSCKYFHPKNNLQSLNPQNISGFRDNNQSPSLQGNQLTESSSLMAGDVIYRMGMSLGNLPPSLQPPPDGGYQSLPFLDWG